MRVSHGKTYDVTILDQLPVEPGAFYVMDKAYTDFARLYRLDRAAAYFVTRAKRNLDARRRASRAVDKTTGLRSDQTIALAGPKSSRGCISRSAAANQLRRCRARQAAGPSDQQLRAAGAVDSQAVPTAVAERLGLSGVNLPHRWKAA